MKVGDTDTITLEVIGPGGSDFELFISLNDVVQDPPVANILGTLTECDYDNNQGSTDVTSLPLQLFAQQVKDNEKCDPALLDNGVASAYYMYPIGVTTCRSYF